MGTIPVLETYGRQDGFYRTFDDLPVLWVDHYDNVTPSLLEEAYPRILRGARNYKFEKLTNWWWWTSSTAFGTVRHVTPAGSFSGLSKIGSGPIVIFKTSRTRKGLKLKHSVLLKTYGMRSSYLLA